MSKLGLTFEVIFTHFENEEIEDKNIKIYFNLTITGDLLWPENHTRGIRTSKEM